MTMKIMLPTMPLPAMTNVAGSCSIIMEGARNGIELRLYFKAPKPLQLVRRTGEGAVKEGQRIGHLLLTSQALDTVTSNCREGGLKRIFICNDNSDDMNLSILMVSERLLQGGNLRPLGSETFRIGDFILSFNSSFTETLTGKLLTTGIEHELWHVSEDLRYPYRHEQMKAIRQASFKISKDLLFIKNFLIPLNHFFLRIDAYQAGRRPFVRSDTQFIKNNFAKYETNKNLTYEDALTTYMGRFIETAGVYSIVGDDPYFRLYSQWAKGLMASFKITAPAGQTVPSSYALRSAQEYLRPILDMLKDDGGQTFAEKLNQETLSYLVSLPVNIQHSSFSLK